jgi:hypothetical protein
MWEKNGFRIEILLKRNGSKTADTALTIHFTKNA